MSGRLGPHLKLPLASSLQALAKARASDQVFLQGRKYPCTVKEVVSPGIVTVNFEVNSHPFTLPQPTVPVVGSEYARLPIRVGDKGMCIAADVRLGGVTGLGTGVPDLTPPGNLSGLAFIWLGNTDWATEDDEGNVIDPESVSFYSTLACVFSVGPSGIYVSGSNGNLYVEGSLGAGNGATGMFTTGTGQTVMVQNGLITNIY
jgi:hypothetical protein